MAKKTKANAETPVAAPTSTETPVAGAPVAEAPAPAPTVAPVVEKPKQPESNGVTRPGDGTATRRVWDIADSISKEKGRPATRAETVQAGAAEGINPSTCTTQFGKWTKFHGLTGDKSPGRVAAAAAEAAPAAPAAPVTEAAPSKFDEGYDAYQSNAKGEQVFNPYAEGTTEHTQFVNGWNTAHNDAQSATPNA